MAAVSPDVELQSPDIVNRQFEYVVEQHDTREQKRKIIKNLLVVSTAFLFLFTAYRSLENLQSSLNKVEGLGLASLSVIYASLIISCMFLPPLLIGRLGYKGTLICSMCCYVVYILSNYYARWWTLIPSSILLGLGAAPLWSAKCAYLTTTGITYASLNNEHQDSTITRFFGIFFLLFQSCQIWGNLISSLIFHQSQRDVNVTSEVAGICGASDCGEALNENITGVLLQPEYSLVIKLVSVYLASGILAIVLIVVLLDNIPTSTVVSREGNLKLLIATLRLVKDDRRMLMLIPLTIYSGLEQAFIVGEFTKSYVTCALGINWVGFVMICFGVSDAIFSFLLGKISKYVGRIPVFISGSLVNLIVIMIMLLWKPTPEYRWLFFVLTLLWGYGDAVWQTQINALYGVLFHENSEAAFSNYRLWESLGFMTAFAYSTFLCVNVKLYIVLLVLLLGMALYLVVEIKHKKTRTTLEVTEEITEG